MPKKSISTSSTSTILGRSHKKEITVKTPTKCVVCLKDIPVARIEALISINTPASRYTHVACSTTTKIKGVYMGENGTSEIKLCDKLYDDSVRSIFRRTEHEAHDEDNPED